jgi:hypothetical protein
MVYKKQQSFDWDFCKRTIYVIGTSVIKRDVMRFYYLRCKIGIIQ